jgi:predicted nuclease of predicted toxin-antitoxin system
MKIVADENIDRLVISRLRDEGHTVLSIRETMPSAPDPNVLISSVEWEGLLITEDKDFGELVFHKKREHVGILLVRLEGIPRTKRIDLVCAVIAEHGDNLLHAFSVLTPHSLRIRELK